MMHNKRYLHKKIEVENDDPYIRTGESDEEDPNDNWKVVEDDSTKINIVPSCITKRRPSLLSEFDRNKYNLKFYTSWRKGRKSARNGNTLSNFNSWFNKRINEMSIKARRTNTDYNWLMNSSHDSTN